MRIGSEWSFLRTFTRVFSTIWGPHKPHEKDLKRKLGNQKAKACFPPSFTSSAPYKALGDQETEDDEGGGCTVRDHMGNHSSGVLTVGCG